MPRAPAVGFSERAGAGSGFLQCICSEVVALILLSLQVGGSQLIDRVAPDRTYEQRTEAYLIAAHWKQKR